MKISSWIVCLVAALTGPALAAAEDFLGAPVISDGKVIVKTASRLEMETPMTHEGVVEFYREELQAFDDIKFRERKAETHIEDNGRLKWHAITVSKGAHPTRVTIVKDNWTWIIGTLILRYVGVFAVLIVLLIGMSLSGAIISRSVKKKQDKTSS